MSGISYEGFVFVMTNKERDRFVIKCTDDLIGAMLKYRKASFRRRTLPYGKRQCKELVYWKGYEDGVRSIFEEAALKRLSEVELRAVVTEFNPGWEALNKEVLSWKR